MAYVAAPRSRNDLFSTDFSILPPATPPKSKPVVPFQAAAQPPANSPTPSTCYIPSSTLLQLRQSSQQLGNGRHAVVYLGSYRSATTSNDGNDDEVGAGWKLCAAKRLSADKEAQLAGLNEALMLSKLAKCPQVIRFIGLQDVREDTTSNGTSAVSSNEAVSTVRPPMHERNRSASTSQSVPSSPNAATSFNIGLVNGSSAQRESPSSQTTYESPLRRASTVKANRSPTALRSEGTREVRSADIPRLVLLTEYCQLGNLADFVGQHGMSHLGQNLFYKLGVDLLKAIVACHDKNIIHGDVKPQNCMIDASFNLKLGDFSSSIFNSPSLVDGIALGTTQYCAPELVMPLPSPFSFPVDIFAAGLVLLYMITGVEPYESLMVPSRTVSRNGSVSKRGGKCCTPTASIKKRARTSSGAGKMVEMHLHLSKGHAWEYEERRRIEELEEGTPFSHGLELLANDRRQSHGDRESDGLAAETIPLLPIDTEHLLGWESSTPLEVPIPLALQDSASDNLRLPRHRTYEDGYTPVQTFLSGHQVVPTELRALIQRMLSPSAMSRPSADQALASLQALSNRT